MAGLLPGPDWRCTAFWYAARTGMLSGRPEADLEFLREFGLRAARIARWAGLSVQLAPEGPFWAHQWPEAVFDAVTADMAAFYCRAATSPYSPDYPARSAVAVSAYLDEPAPGYWAPGGS